MESRQVGLESRLLRKGVMCLAVVGHFIKPETDLAAGDIYCKL